MSLAAYDELDVEQSQRITKMLMKLFDHWQLTYAEQAILLGFSSKTRTTINRYKKGDYIRFDRDTYDRARFLLAIHKSLRTIFPMNQEIVYAWFKTPNRAFSNRTPLQVVNDDGFLGLADVYQYLENYKAM